SIDIPQDLMKELLKCKDNSQIYAVGVEWCTAQAKELLAHGAKAIHFYTMGKADNVKEIVRRAF
ncbi:MAG: methylenetetrahydrofolate reductase, partial [Bacteroidales bacterium]|nr:methylenetetrahydrofolate reductase [Bacteroidales bacterium]